MGDPGPPRLRTPPAASGFTNLNVDVEARFEWCRRSDAFVIPNTLNLNSPAQKMF